MFLYAKHFYIFYKKEMKKFLKWFTLVEILIVIVIIGILISALVPRMSAAQGRARDVARKNDLNQLQAAIVVSYQDKWGYPCSVNKCKDGKESTDGDAKNSFDWLNIQDFREFLIAAWMNNVPSDPMATNVFKGIEDTTSATWDYMYLTIKSHGVPNWWFALMAKSEVEWSSNWVVCTNNDGTIAAWKIDSEKSDVKDFHACSSIRRSNWANDDCSNGNATADGTFSNEAKPCVYKDEGDLRYVVVY